MGLFVLSEAGTGPFLSPTILGKPLLWKTFWCRVTEGKALISPRFVFVAFCRKLSKNNLILKLPWSGYCVINLDDVWPGPSLESPCPSCGSRCIWEAWSRCRPDPWWSRARGSPGSAGRSSSRTLPLKSAWEELTQSTSNISCLRPSFKYWDVRG